MSELDFPTVQLDGPQIDTSGSLQQMIIDALAAHDNWKRRLHAAIATSAADVTVEQASVDNGCAFGRWLYDDVPWRARKAWDYTNVRKLHAAFHQEAGKVLALALAGHSNDALIAMTHGSAFADTSDKLAFALRDWYGRVDDQAEGLKS